MMIVYNQSWAKKPTKEIMKQAGPSWNMWKTQMYPYKILEENDQILMIASNSRQSGMMMYTSQVRYLVKAKYRSKSHAWELLSTSIPKEFLKNEDSSPMTKKDFLAVEYTVNAAPSGYLLSFLDVPVRWIGLPRTKAVMLNRDGWGSIPDNKVPGEKSGSKSALLVEDEDDIHERRTLERVDIGPREKQTLVMSRRGQGKFKSNVSAIESGCRITGTRVKKHLIASHINPWAKSNDEEKLDGNNGLLLAPHVDHLFNIGLISFKDNGDLMVSSRMSKSILGEWSLPKSKNVGKFNAKQRKYLKMHREKIYKK